MAKKIYWFVRLGVCFYGLVTFYTYLAYIAIAVWRRPNVFTLLDEFERLTERSKCEKTHSVKSINYFLPSELSTGSKDNTISRKMYTELSEKIERVSKILFFLTKISYVGTNIPASLITLFSYFVLDLKKESFFLPYPTMYDPRKGKLKP